MNRRWYLAIAICLVASQELLPAIPVPAEWHGFIDKLPGFFGAINALMGWQAFNVDKNGVPLDPKPQEPPRS